MGRTRIGFTFGLSARAGAGGHGATLGHAPALRGGYSGQCAKPLRMATRDPTLDRRAHLLGSQPENVTSANAAERDKFSAREPSRYSGEERELAVLSLAQRELAV